MVRLVKRQIATNVDTERFDAFICEACRETSTSKVEDSTGLKGTATTMVGMKDSISIVKEDLQELAK
jgi:hypothetical protein